MGNSGGSKVGKPSEIRHLPELEAPPVLCRRRPNDHCMPGDRKSSGGQPPRENTDPRRTANPPTGSRKGVATPAKTPKSSPDAAIPPEKLNAANDR
jgi:hypothetical protein